MDVDPLPQTEISRIIGLLETLDDHQGREDIYKLARELNYEFGELLSVIKACEVLELVNTPGGDVILTELGKEFLASGMNGKKGILKKQMGELSLIKYLKRRLSESDEHNLSKDDVLDDLRNTLPNENAESLFNFLVNWGRYAEIFGYNNDSETLYLDEGQEIE